MWRGYDEITCILTTYLVANPVVPPMNRDLARALDCRDAAGTRPSEYPAGALLALVTWAQWNDPHWFGRHIPDTPSEGRVCADIYRMFEGKALTTTHATTQRAEPRTDFILTLKPVSLR